jgi:chromate reductase, NAD(P)H dehydrogenase (quinone)
MREINLVGISGSLRKKSFNTLLLEDLKNYLPEGVNLKIIQIADIPIYNADLDLPEALERPLVVQRFRDDLAIADGIVLVSPEYNYSIPGGLKNAIDWASRGKDSPLLRKPVALMGATIGLWGTARMQLAFLPVFQFLDMRVVYKPEVQISQAANKFDTEGKVSDETTKKLVKEKLKNLVELAIEVKTKISIIN